MDVQAPDQTNLMTYAIGPLAVGEQWVRGCLNSPGDSNVREPLTEGTLVILQMGKPGEKSLRGRGQGGGGYVWVGVRARTRVQISEGLCTSEDRTEWEVEYFSFFFLSK